MTFNQNSQKNNWECFIKKKIRDHVVVKVKDNKKWSFKLIIPIFLSKNDTDVSHELIFTKVQNYLTFSYNIFIIHVLKFILNWISIIDH